MPAPTSKHPANWSEEEIRSDCVKAREDFRARRMSDPKADYEAEFDGAKKSVEFVISKLPDILREPAPTKLLGDIVSDQKRFIALRYLLAPPISEDDLDTLLDAKLSAKALNADAALAERFAALLRAGIDAKRFPWLSSGAKPAASAVKAAELATTVAAAIQRVQTKRRSDEKDQLEGAIEHQLSSKLKMQRIPVPRESITNENFRDTAPNAGQFMRGATLGGDNGDFVIGLWNNRLLALECKSSNSEINSRKRLNKEVVKNAGAWVTAFGSMVIPGAALRGVFKPEYVRDAQAAKVALFWGHRLGDLLAFIATTRH